MKPGSNLREDISISAKQEFDFSLSYSRSELPKLSLLNEVFKSSLVIILLMVSFGLAGMWVSQGLGWVFDSRVGVSPLLSCPSLGGQDAWRDSDYCKIILSPWSDVIYNQILFNQKYAVDEDEAKVRGLCVLPKLDPDTGVYVDYQSPIHCWTLSSCSIATDWDPLNPYSVSSIAKHTSQSTCGVTLDGMRFTMDCFQIYAAEPYCDAGFTVDPVGILSLRGVLLGILLLWCMLVSYDVYVCLKVSQLMRQILDYKEKFLDLTISCKCNELLRRCHLKWSSFVAHSVQSAGSLTPSIESLGGGGASPLVASLPYQPVLSRRTSVVFESKASPSGYSPRLDSPPVGVMTTIQSSASRSSRVTGSSVEALFSSSWRKRVNKSFELRAKNLQSIALRSRRKLMHVLLCVVGLVGFFTLAFRLIISVSSRSGQYSLWSLVALGSDRTGSVSSRVELDLVSDHVLLVWSAFIAFLDVFFSAIVLFVFAFFSGLKPLDMNFRDIPKLTEKEDFVVELENKPSTSLQGLDDTHVSSEPTESPILSLSGKLHRRASLTSSSLDSLAQLIDGGYDQRCSETLICAMVSVMSPCSTAEGKGAFVKKLKALQKLMVNEEDIFVIDCGRSRRPIDDTEFVICREVSDRIHYVYFPEPDRLLSIYWTSKYWIPFQFSSNRCGDYIYSLIVDEWVQFPSQFLLPDQEFLLGNPKIKAMYIPVGDEPQPGGERIQLVSIFNIAGSTSHAGSACPQIWERNTLEMTCFGIETNHEEESNTHLFHSLSLRANGRALLNQRGGSLITVILCETGVKPRRTKAQWSGRLDPPIISTFRDLIDPSAFWHLSSLLGKPFVLAQVLNILLDSSRIFLIALFLLRDPLGYAVVALFAGIVSILPLLVNLTLSMRYEESPLSKTLSLIFARPFLLLLVDLPLRIIRLFKFSIIPILFRRYEGDETIGEREEEFRDLPPVPPHPCPHWPSVWT